MLWFWLQWKNKMEIKNTIEKILFENEIDLFEYIDTIKEGK